MKRKELPIESPTDDLNPWANPIFRDVDSFLIRITTFIDIFGSAHTGIPKRGSAKFIQEIKKHGFEMKPIEVDSPNLINKNTQKKFQFFEISRAKI